MAPSLLALWVGGMLTFASPCILPLIPIYLATLGGGLGGRGARGGRWRMVLSATAFAVGMSSVFALLGAGATVLGTRLLAHRDALLIMSGLVMVVFGLRGLGMIRLPLLDRDARPILSRVRTSGSLAAAFLFGAAFALGWSPCVGPLLASALAYAALHASSPWRGAGLLAVYASGIALPLVLAAAVADRALGWLRRSQSLLPRLEHATGVLLVGVGLWIAYGAWTDRQAALEAGAPCPSAAGSQGCDLPRGAGAPSAPVTIAGPRLVEFVSPNCPACRRMAPVLARAEEQCSGLGARTTRVDVAQASGLSLARQHRIVGTPTI